MEQVGDTAEGHASDLTCPDCGAVLPDGKADCRQLFEEVLVRDYSDYRYFDTHRLLVDAYSLQHPDVHMRSGKSFAAHLTGMCAAFEYGNSASVERALRRWLDGARQIDKPAGIPGPAQRGDLTVVHVHGAARAAEHTERVREWAHSVWEAWSDHHDLARQWVEAAVSES